MWRSQKLHYRCIQKRNQLSIGFLFCLDTFTLKWHFYQLLEVNCNKLVNTVYRQNQTSFTWKDSRILDQVCWSDTPLSCFELKPTNCLWHASQSWWAIFWLWITMIMLDGWSSTIIISSSLQVLMCLMNSKIIFGLTNRPYSRANNKSWCSKSKEKNHRVTFFKDDPSHSDVQQS